MRIEICSDTKECISNVALVAGIVALFLGFTSLYNDRQRAFVDRGYVEVPLPEGHSGTQNTYWTIPPPAPAPKIEVVPAPHITLPPGLQLTPNSAPAPAPAAEETAPPAIPNAPYVPRSERQRTS